MELITQNSIEKIDFLKIDCEGGEYDVFQSDNSWVYM
jgi:FkbM family methyltransferase